MDEIAALAAVSKQTVYNHYGSKAELVVAAIEQANSTRGGPPGCAEAVRKFREATTQLLGMLNNPGAFSDIRIAQLNKAHVFYLPIVTKIEPGRDFYPAEDYHQDFLTRNPTFPYIVVNDLPKIENLKRLFPDLYRSDPVLVAAAASRN